MWLTNTVSCDVFTEIQIQPLSGSFVGDDEEKPNYNFGPTNHFNQFLFFILNPLSNLKSVKDFIYMNWMSNKKKLY